MIMGVKKCPAFWSEKPVRESERNSFFPRSYRPVDPKSFTGCSQAGFHPFRRF
jgi:hypothetical protein